MLGVFAAVDWTAIASEFPVVPPVGMAFGVEDYDPERARELWAEAGYPQGFGMVVLYLSEYEELAGATRMIHGYLEEAGLQPELIGTSLDELPTLTGEILLDGRAMLWLQWE